MNLLKTKITTAAVGFFLSAGGSPSQEMPANSPAMQTKPSSTHSYEISVHNPSDFVTPSQADPIRELCAQASATNDPKEFERGILELQIAIHVHSEKLRIMVA